VDGCGGASTEEGRRHCEGWNGIHWCEVMLYKRQRVNETLSTLARGLVAAASLLAVLDFRWVILVELWHETAIEHER